MSTTHEPRLRALVIHPVIAGAPIRDTALRLDEATGLAEALDLEVAHADVVAVRSVNPGSFFGSGRVETVGEAAADHDASVVVVDVALTPVQQRNLERAWNAKVLDRTGLILEIFGLRARTKEGTLQVELARLAYERSRLVRTWTHLERQRGGRGFLAGPGETQIEADRRVIGEKIAKLRKELEDVRRTRGLHRANRKRAPFPMIALVGYTNAGKSTLFNALTDAKVLAKDMPFATLDPTLRGVTLPSGAPAMLADTVGFISDLPPDLVAAFEATLEEVREADLLVHVRDIAHAESDEQRADVDTILDRLSAGPEHGQPIVEVWNKVDLLSEEDRSVVEMRATRANADCAFTVTPMAAARGWGLDAVLTAMDAAITAGAREWTAEVPAAEGRALAWLHEHGQVMSEAVDDDGTTTARVRLSEIAAGRYQRSFGALRLSEPDAEAAQ